jgi:hypothetical protein
MSLHGGGIDVCEILQLVTVEVEIRHILDLARWCSSAVKHEHVIVVMVGVSRCRPSYVVRRSSGESGPAPHQPSSPHLTAHSTTPLSDW